MNSLELDVPKNIVPPPDDGDIYIDPDDHRPYILAKVDGMNFAAISLVDGNRFSDAQLSKEAAVRGLVFFGRNVNISLKVKK